MAAIQFSMKWKPPRDRLAQSLADISDAVAYDLENGRIDIDDGDYYGEPAGIDDVPKLTIEATVRAVALESEMSSDVRGIIKQARTVGEDAGNLAAFTLNRLVNSNVLATFYAYEHLPTCFRGFAPTTPRELYRMLSVVPQRIDEDKDASLLVHTPTIVFHALILASRLINGSHKIIDAYSVYNLYVACFGIAIGFWMDNPISNASLCRVYHTDVATIFECQLYVLKTIRWDVHVTPDEVEYFTQNIANDYANTLTAIENGDLDDDEQ